MVVQAAGRWGVERLAIMRPATREFVRASHVVEVAVGEHDDGVPFEQLGEVLAQGGDPDARVDDEVTVSPAQVPDVGSLENRDMWLNFKALDPFFTTRWPLRGTGTLQGSAALAISFSMVVSPKTSALNGRFSARAKIQSVLLD